MSNPHRHYGNPDTSTDPVDVGVTEWYILLTLANAAALFAVWLILTIGGVGA